MKIKNIQIKNFKSIKELTIPLQEYGRDNQKSKTTFLVGINESGKSAILEAISLINEGFDGKDYEDYCFLDAQENNEYVDIYAKIEIDNISFWRKKIIEKLKISNDFVKQIEFISLEKNTYLNNEDFGITYNLEINDDLPFYLYIIDGAKDIKLLKETNDIKDNITIENASSFLADGQELLTKKELEEKIVQKLKIMFNINMPKIQIWKSKPEYLINDIIDLNEFKEDTSISIPLKNIFHIYGKLKDDDIKITIEKALSNQARTDELKEKMTDKVTKHINKIWKEHKIKIRVSINGYNCQVQVEDKDKKFTYYTMEQRSDGFKRFISLILSLSAQNDSNKLKNNIILIDEPEVHLHPSGIQYMRDEILKIGKNNNIIVSTHSQNMVDTSTPERHWVVKKNKSETSIIQIDQDTPIEDDKVIASAFGLNLFKELLPKNIIIVEGKDDKNIIAHSLKLLQDRFFYSIKSLGGASKMPGFASLLGGENIPAFFLFDADKEGRDNKKKILDNQKDNYNENNVFTIKGLQNTLPTDSTIEDLLPIDFVKDFFDKEIEVSFEFKSDEAIIQQIKKQNESLKNNKQKMDSLKIKLSEEFCKEYDTKEKILEIPKLYGFIDSLVDKLK